MARFRYAVLENDKALASTSTSGTETIDLPENGILSSVNLQTRCAQTYTDNHTLPFFLALTKIELLVNGSTVVKSLTGRQARALSWYSGGPFSVTNDYEPDVNSNLVYKDFPLYLGRTVDDTKFGLDLARYNNPQLKFTYDLSTVAYDGVTYDSNTTNPTLTYNVMAKVLDGVPPGFQNRYIQSSEIDSWTVAASTEHDTQIPRGYDLYGLMLECRYKALGFNDFFDHVKLDFDNGKWLPIDMDYENLAILHKEAWPQPCEVNLYDSLANADDLDTQLMYVNGAGNATVGGNVACCKLPILYYPINVVTMQDFDGAAITSPTQVQSTIKGWGPHQTFYIPMRMLLDGEAMAVDTKQFGRIDCKVKTGASSGSSAITRIVAEYVKPNGE